MISGQSLSAARDGVEPGHETEQGGSGMFVSNPAALLPELPVIDSSEAQWAIEYLTVMIERVGPDSAVGMVLRQARRELQSLLESAEATVAGPLRIAA